MLQTRVFTLDLKVNATDNDEESHSEEVLDEEAEGIDNVSGALLLEHKKKRESCVDPEAEDAPFPEWSHKGNPTGTVIKCKNPITWVKSQWLLDLLAKYKKDPDSYQLTMCWADSVDAERRWFPWMYTSTKDFRNTLTYEGSTIITPIELLDIWMDGYMQIMPNALDYFARMGEIEDRKIIPKFMVFGWSKGANGNWKLAKDRSDIIQGSALLHGCDAPKKFDETKEKKANAMATRPTMLMSSQLDKYVKCTYSDSKKYYSKFKKYGLWSYHETPCGHHPDSCWPACPDLMESYVNPFFNFVKACYADDRLCNRWDNQEDCVSVLCLWDTELDVCTDAHPVGMTPSCERFCEKQLVDSCADAANEADCSNSFEILPVEAVDAKGMHAKCEFTEGSCTPSTEAFQCFFQDQC